MQFVKNNSLLNDHCMLEVFKFFNLKDLLIVSEVSIQFEKLARSTFIRKYKHLELSNHLVDNTESKLLKLFKTFGHLIETLQTPLFFYPWYKKETQKFIILLIKKYCARKNSRLESLKLNYFGHINRYLCVMNDVFANLKILHLEYVAIPFSTLQLINKLPKINELNISYCIPILPISTMFRPTVNFNLKKLTLRCRNKLLILDVLHVIHELYPNVTELTFLIIGYMAESREEIWDIFKNIGSLKYLTKLDIDVSCEPIEHLISRLHSNGHQLKYLCIRYAKITSKTSQVLAELKSLNELFVTDTINEYPLNILHLVQSMPNIRTISMIDTAITMRELNSIVYIAKNLTKGEFKMANSIMDENLLQSITHTVENRKNKEPLRLVLHVNGLNKLDEYKNYISQKNRTNTLLHINLTYKGINTLALST